MIAMTTIMIMSRSANTRVTMWRRRWWWRWWYGNYKNAHLTSSS